MLELVKVRIEHLEQARKSLQEIVWTTEVKSSEFPIIKNLLITVQGLLYSYEMTDEVREVIRNLKEKGE